MGLDVGVAAAEQLLGALDGELFRDIDDLAAAVVAAAGVALRVFVGQDGALRLQHGGGDDVFGGDQLDLSCWRREFAADGERQFRIAVGEGGGEEFFDANEPFYSLSAFDKVDGEAAERCFLVFGLHVGAGFPHGRITLSSETWCWPSPRRARRAALIALMAPIALRSMQGIWTRPPIGSQVRPRLCSMPISAAFSICSGVPPMGRGEAGGGHRAGDADLALAADLGAGDRGVRLVEHADGAGGQQEA